MNIINENSNRCIIPGCNYIIKIKSRQLCIDHYTRWQRTGNAETPLKIAPKGEPLRFLKECISNRNQDKCWIWPFGKDSNGYPSIRIEGKLSRVTYQALELTGNIRPNSPNNYCLHSCDIRSCFNPSHLRWGSPKNNIDDMILRKRDNFKPGSDSNKKLTDEDVLEIRDNLHQLTSRQLGEIFGVSHSRIIDIWNYKAYKNVLDPIT